MAQSKASLNSLVFSEEIDLMTVRIFTACLLAIAATTIARADLVSYWDFEGASPYADRAGSNDGTANDVSIVTDTTRGGNVAVFDGSDNDSYVSFGYDSSMDIASNGAFSVVGWIRFVNQSGTQILFTRRGPDDGGAPFPFEWFTLNGTQKIGIGDGDVADTPGSIDWANDATFTKLGNGQWAQVAVTWEAGSASDNVKHYLNFGTTRRTSSVDGPNSIDVDNDEAQLGSKQYVSDDEFNGRMDDFSYWVGEALSEGKIVGMFNLDDQLDYDTLDADALFDTYDGTTGPAAVDGTTWYKATDLTGSPGELLDLGGGDYALVLDASGGGVTTIPEPGTLALLLGALAACVIPIRAGTVKR
jgi:hypothetical protein